MIKKLKLELDGSALEFVVRRLLLAGFTGRYSKLVDVHIAELERQGIHRPDARTRPMNPPFALKNIP